MVARILSVFRLALRHRFRTLPFIKQQTHHALVTVFRDGVLSLAGSAGCNRRAAVCVSKGEHE